MHLLTRLATFLLFSSSILAIGLQGQTTSSDSVSLEELESAEIWEDGSMATPVKNGVAIYSYQEGKHLIATYRLPEGTKLGSSEISFDERVTKIAGTDSDVILFGDMGSVVSVQWNDSAGFTTSPLPKLPQILSNIEATMLGDSLYVFGLSRDGNSASSENALLSLNPPSDTEWTSLEAFPGVPRLDTSLLAHGDRLILFGGKSASESDNYLSDIWSYRLKPTDGTTESGWLKAGSLPIPLARSSAFVSGQSHAVILGGYMGDEAPSNSILVYHKVTETTINAGSASIANATGVISSDEARHTLLITEGPQAGALMKINITPTTETLSTIDYVVMVFYFALMAGIGFYFARKQNSSEEFALGSRNVAWWAAGISMFATAASSISFMAIPALAFRSSLIWMFPNFLLVLIFVVNAYLIFPLLRNLKMTSTYEYLESRYNPALRLIASFQCIAFQVLGRMSVVLLLPALAISAVTGLDVGTSVLLMGCLTTVYTALGGFEAVIWTDVCQGILMVLGAILMIVLAIAGLPGGISEFVSVNTEFQRFDMGIWAWDYTLPVVWILAFNIIAQNLGYVADQPFIQRVFATPEREMKRLAGMSAFCGIVIAVLVNLVGLAIFAYFHAHPDQLSPVMKNDEVIPLYIVQRIPIGIAGLIIAALFAASMSTLSSSMNSVATLITEDFYRRLFKQSTDRSRLLLMKTGSLVIGLIGTGIALYMAKLNIDSMFMIWNEIMALLGGGFVGVYMLGMFTKRTNSGGALIGIACSILSVLAFKYGTDVHVFLYTPVALASCVLGGFFGSLLFRSPDPESLGELTIYEKR